LLGDNVPAGDGSLPWIVTAPISALCRIRVTDVADPGITDTGDGLFTVYRALTWITLDRSHGSVPQGSSDDIEVILDTRGLPLDTYEAEIVISHNAGDPVVVPVTLIVESDLSAIGDDSARLVLARNQPNPFNPRTTISFTLPAADRVNLSVYDVRGRRVRTLLDGGLSAGTHFVIWEGKNDAGQNLASGVYFYHLHTATESLSKKMLLLK
jgi:hypothetical protein